MLAEQWIYLNPSVFFSKKYLFKSYLDDKAILEIILLEKNNNLNSISIVFMKSSDAVRISKTAARDRILSFLKETYGNDFCEDCAIFKVDNSIYKKWLIKENYEIYDFSERSLFVFITKELFIEVMTIKDPFIALIDSQNRRILINGQNSECSRFAEEYEEYMRLYPENNTDDDSTSK